MFFLEISAVEKKNLELLQKVMRIRSSHLIKKNYLNNVAIEKESPKNLEQPLKEAPDIEIVQRNLEFSKPNNEINSSRPELPSRMCSEKLDLSLFSTVIFFWANDIFFFVS